MTKEQYLNLKNGQSLILNENGKKIKGIFTFNLSGKEGYNSRFLFNDLLAQCYERDRNNTSIEQKYAWVINHKRCNVSMFKVDDND